jgi:hypothetical protein
MLLRRDKHRATLRREDRGLREPSSSRSESSSARDVLARGSLGLAMRDVLLVETQRQSSWRSYSWCGRPAMDAGGLLIAIQPLRGMWPRETIPHLTFR